MTFTERYTWAGLAISLATFVGYWSVVVARAVTDGLPLVDVAWRGPMLWSLVLGGGLYAVVMPALWLRGRGEALTDVRDQEIERYAETAGARIVGLAVPAALVVLALDVPPFWTATVLFTGSFLGALTSTGVALVAYRRGL
ncbi:hypothetical protein [Pseudonocardia spirodelae]|uniref:DUF4199 domain-containing protein n=1 Tax=Pseudonocardia spirodelae TaxID=3133431 RepID=A0ABU8T9Q0_9PSEU